MATHDDKLNIDFENDDLSIDFDKTVQRLRARGLYSDADKLEKLLAQFDAERKKRQRS